MSFFTHISNGLQFIMEIIKRIVSYLLSSYNAANALRIGLAIGIAVSVIFMTIKLIKGSTWGS